MTSTSKNAGNYTHQSIFLSAFVIGMKFNLDTDGSVTVVFGRIYCVYF